MVATGGATGESNRTGTCTSDVMMKHHRQEQFVGGLDSSRFPVSR